MEAAGDLIDNSRHFQGSRIVVPRWDQGVIVLARLKRGRMGRFPEFYKVDKSEG
jgi:hypothetical protein